MGRIVGFFEAADDKIICYMHPDGSINWRSSFYSDFTKKTVNLELDQKTAVIEIKIHGMKVSKREMVGDILVITYA